VNQRPDLPPTWGNEPGGRRKTENRSKKRSQLLVVFLIFFFLSPPALEGRRDEAGTAPLLSGFHGGAWTHPPPVSVASGGDAPPLFRAQKPSSTVPAFSAIPVDFLGFYFVTFELYLIYFEFLLFVLHVEKGCVRKKKKKRGVCLYFLFMLLNYKN
jgi:hypothetical protein